MRNKKWLSYGGIVASLVLIAFGIASIVVGANGRSEVRNDVKREAIVGSADMSPKAIKAEAAQAGLKNVPLPSCTVANQAIETGSQAKCFASYMRIHTLEATGGKTYAEMPRYATADGKGTNDPAVASKSAGGQPLDNPKRDIWVTYTSLTTALNAGYMAEQMSLFGIVVGVALLLTGVGFLVLALGGALRNPETSIGFVRKWAGHAQPAA